MHLRLEIDPLSTTNNILEVQDHTTLRTSMMKLDYGCMSGAMQRKPWCSGAACRKSPQPVSLEIQTGLGLSPASKRMEPRRSTPRRLFATDQRKTWLEAACIFVFYSLARRRYFRASVAVYSVAWLVPNCLWWLHTTRCTVPGLGCDTVTYGPFPHTGLIRAGQGYQVPCSASLAPGTGYGGKYCT
ncbi:predicted protein [Histoplasma capsulatum G186AR]|uniref:Uncharacterized protein n=1 Tax=Ajellomyces capsulatus (strain G186AR / H82 / ATCC MYA-2454 / RMSCC 2432) TaxID=447093 RepID=C0NJ83_AJECG|nr:uncharacterized protein HCBG_03213 [Histoplasma capsulatum G186AR]EEH07924.1 predicted protein [Histoplasma capsulatum G186AR]